MRSLRQAQSQVPMGPRKAQATRVYEVRGAQGAVRVAGGGGSGSGGGKREGQGEGSRNVAVRRGEAEEEEDGHEGRQ